MFYVRYFRFRLGENTEEGTKSNFSFLIDSVQQIPSRITPPHLQTISLLSLCGLGSVHVHTYTLDILRFQRQNMPRATSERFSKNHEPAVSKSTKEDRSAAPGSGARNPLFK